jgi:hypothetical protein
MYIVTINMFKFHLYFSFKRIDFHARSPSQCFHLVTLGIYAWQMVSILFKSKLYFKNHSDTSWHGGQAKNIAKIVNYICKLCSYISKK